MKEGENFWKYKFNDWSRDITSLANPLILVLVPFIFIGPKAEFYTLLVALAVNEFLGSLIKIVFPKTRPNGQKYSNLLEKIDAGSFPSLHSSRIVIVYLSMFSFADNLIMKVLFLLVILGVVLSRINLKKHFLSDVIGGLVIGTIIWYVSVYLV